MCEFHIIYISKKTAKVLGVLCKLKPYWPRDILITIYKSLILPHFDYCSEVWGSLGNTLIVTLQNLQNSATRIITNSSYEIRSENIYINRTKLAEVGK